MEAKKGKEPTAKKVLKEKLVKGIEKVLALPVAKRSKKIQKSIDKAATDITRKVLKADKEVKAKTKSPARKATVASKSAKPAAKKKVTKAK